MTNFVFISRIPGLAGENRVTSVRFLPCDDELFTEAKVYIFFDLQLSNMQMMLFMSPAINWLSSRKTFSSSRSIELHKFEEKSSCHLRF